MSTKTKVTLVIPESLQKEFKQKVIDDGYGMRGKSKWVTEAIYFLLSLKEHEYINLVSIADEFTGFGKVETVVIDKALKTLLDNAVLKVRKIHPVLEGVQSRIIRTSVLQRLLRS